MAEHLLEQRDQTPPKRFTTSEDFKKEYYPRSTEEEAQRKLETEGGFGAELAFQSLSRHADVLRFPHD